MDASCSARSGSGLGRSYKARLLVCIAYAVKADHFWATNGSIKTRVCPSVDDFYLIRSSLCVCVFLIVFFKTVDEL